MKLWLARAGVFGLVLLTGASLWAQSSASITGTVTDKSGGVIPGATVTLVEPARGQRQTASTNAAGGFLFAGLDNGAYQLTVAAKGFQRYAVKNIALRAGQQDRVNAVLQVGSVNSTVEVSGTAVGRVQLENATVSNTVTGKQVTQLVLNGRNFSSLITLVPGVVNSVGGMGTPSTEGQVGVAGSVAYDVNGGRSEYNNWEIDGSNVEDNGSNGTLNVYPSVDAISQVQIMTSNYGAEYGRDSSGAILVQTKSGTNQWHGDAYEFVRNTDLNARNFFDYPNRAVYKKNDWGFTIGGPIKKNKAFIFWSEEWRKSSTPNEFQQAVPSVQERAGNFADVCPTAGEKYSLDPTIFRTGDSSGDMAFPDCPIQPNLTTTTGGPDGNGQVTLWPNDTVPISANAKLLMGLVPAPNFGSGVLSTYNTSISTPTNWREELFRVDDNINSSNHLYFNFIHDAWNTISVPSLWGNGGLPTVETNFVGPGVAMVAHLTSTITPNLINEFVAGYTADHINLDDTGPIQRGSFQMAGIYNNGFGGLLPSFNVSSVNDASFVVDTGDTPWNNSNPTYTYRDQITQIVGNHSLHYGAEFTASQKNEMGSQEPQGTLNFCGGGGTCWPGTSGNGLADMYLGLIQSFSQNSLRPKYFDRYKTADLFLQDDWHASSNLTVNVGLQLDLLGTYYNANDLDANFEPQAYNSAAFPGYNTSLADGSMNTTQPFYDGLVQCGLNGVPQSCTKGHLWNWAPRVGFSWDPFGQGTTAIRAGYGIFYDHTNGNEIMDQLRNAPVAASSSVANLSGWSAVNGAAAEIFPLTPGAIPTQQIWPYVQQWNLNIQHQLRSGLVATVAYVGSKGTHLSDERDMNQPQLLPSSENPFAPGQPMTGADCTAFTNNGTLANGTVPSAVAVPYLNQACGVNGIGANAIRPYLGYGGINLIEMEANSNYNALQATLRETMGGLTFDLAYTWSHSLDDSSDYSDAAYVNSYDRDLAYADSAFDIPQNLSLSWVYNVPVFGQNKWLGGWEWSGIMHAQSGSPLSVTGGSSLGLARSYALGTTPNIVGDPTSGVTSPPVPYPAGPVFYNPDVYRSNRGLAPGTVGRFTLRGPDFINFNMGLFKNFKLSERQSIQLRGEAFNVFNHTEWLPFGNTGICFGGPDALPTDPSCAASNSGDFRPTSAQPGRIVQLAIKYIF